MRTIEYKEPIDSASITKKGKRRSPLGEAHSRGPSWCQLARQGSKQDSAPRVLGGWHGRSAYAARVSTRRLKVSCTH
jgi:hypothetical protein